VALFRRSKTGDLEIISGSMSRGALLVRSPELQRWDVAARDIAEWTGTFEVPRAPELVTD
jgi:hypothetical protein